MKRWTNLGFVDTIYEEEEDYVVDHSSSLSSSSSSSLSLSPLKRINLSSSSPSMELESRVHKWSLVNNSKPDVFVNVGGTRFHLHKDPLSRKSGYLKRHLTGVNELTISPPLNITAETFSLIASFCYGAHIDLTPFNIVAVRISVTILLMIKEEECRGKNDVVKESLLDLTESYLRRVVLVNVDYIKIVLRSCLALLPESETTSFMVGRCVEALIEIEDGDAINEFLEEAVILPVEDFVVVAYAVQLRFSDHDLLYRIVDAYVKEHDGEITEEEKVQICNSIDCDRLSPPLLLHAVQNPKMPLRFIVRAMLQEQLNTRHSIMAAAATAVPTGNRHHEVVAAAAIAAARDSSVTLGSLLQRDTAARQNSRLKAAMSSTSSRISSLEKELEDMKKFITKESSERIIIEPTRSSNRVIDSARSASFHQVSNNNLHLTRRGERGSVSSLSTTFRRGGERATTLSDLGRMPRREKSLGKRLINGIKNVFSSSSSKDVAKKDDVEEIYDGLEDFVWIKDDIDEELGSNNK
ncbi:unnamed protein product [Cochlearia groenlandica]